MTLSEQLQNTNNRPAGFDYLRICLALSIVVWHTAVTSYGHTAQAALSLGIFRPVWAILLPMFFSLSGFLVSGSLERSKTIVEFLGLRLIRLLPALSVESIITVILIGPIFTDLKLESYFLNVQTYAYFLNIVGDVHYYLPGVFESNPIATVNGQLWTLPSEFKCYFIIAVLYLCGSYWNKLFMAFSCLVLQAYVTYRAIGVFANQDPEWGIVGSGVLIMSFIYGALFYRFRKIIPWSAKLFLISLIISFVTLSFNLSNSFSGLPTAYLTVYIGLTNPKRLSFVSSGDYSYGIFLYGYPIQQAVSAALPDLRVWWINLIISTPIIFLTAWLSWHLVEKRALKLRRFLTTF